MIAVLVKTAYNWIRLFPFGCTCCATSCSMALLVFRRCFYIFAFYPDPPFGSSGKMRQPADGTDGWDRKPTLLAPRPQCSTPYPMARTGPVLLDKQSPILLQASQSRHSDTGMVSMSGAPEGQPVQCRVRQYFLFREVKETYDTAILVSKKQLAPYALS